MARKLKVYRTPIGFHDAYVAAPSQKAALAAWGSDADLFARGIAEVVTDDALTKEPLDSPGKVIKRPRGNADDYMDALPKPKPPVKRRKQSGADDARPARRSHGQNKAEPPAKPRLAPKPTPKRRSKPRPSRAKFEAAEQAIETANADYAAAVADLRRREHALRDERRQLDERHGAQISKLEASLGKARSAYQAAIEKWAAEDR
jgi:hypothetical protein